MSRDTSGKKGLAEFVFFNFHRQTWKKPYQVLESDPLVLYLSLFFGSHPFVEDFFIGKICFYLVEHNTCLQFLA